MVLRVAEPRRAGEEESPNGFRGELGCDVIAVFALPAAVHAAAADVRLQLLRISGVQRARPTLLLVRRERSHPFQSSQVRSSPARGQAGRSAGRQQQTRCTGWRWRRVASVAPGCLPRAIVCPGRTEEPAWGSAGVWRTSRAGLPAGACSVQGHCSHCSHCSRPGTVCLWILLKTR